MVKLSQALAAIIFGTFIPTIYSLGIFGSEFGAVGGLKSYHSYPGTIQSLSETDLFQDVDEKSLSRRRAELTLSQECIDGTKKILNEDIRYNTTRVSVISSCPIRNTNQDGTVAFVADYRDCDDSAYLAFCDANYQSIKLRNVKVACALNPADLNPVPKLIYYYGSFECVDPSCPSELSPEDTLKIMFLFDGDNATTCIAEFMEEGEEPQVELADAIVPDNLSKECIDQIDARNSLFAADEEYVNITSSPPECVQIPKFQWMSGNDTFLVFDRDTVCDEGQEYDNKRRAYCEAQPNYQLLEFGTVKATCVGLSNNGAGDFFVYYTQIRRCQGLSCPANPADWSILDIKYTKNPGTIESCEWELIGAEEIPEPPETAAPAIEDDATAAPEEEAGGVAAPEEETGGGDASAAPEDGDQASLDDESSASGFVAGITITLPLAAAFRLLA